jgi:hypothetical protein
MKRKGAAMVQEKTSRMTPRQEIDFWRRQTKALRQRQTRIAKKSEKR